MKIFIFQRSISSTSSCTTNSSTNSSSTSSSTSSSSSSSSIKIFLKATFTKMSPLYYFKKLEQ